MQNKKLNSGIMSWLVPSSGPVATPPRNDGNGKWLAVAAHPPFTHPAPWMFGRDRPVAQPLPLVL